jgi:hypothetical protein
MPLGGRRRIRRSLRQPERRQALVEDARTVALDSRSGPVRRTSRSRLREVDFRFGEQMLRGLEQNPKTNSCWTQMAREGKRVMQFLSDLRYIANVVDGGVQVYGRGSRGEGTDLTTSKEAGCWESNVSCQGW